jgi:hypothetical protein
MNIYPTPEEDEMLDWHTASEVKRKHVKRFIAAVLIGCGFVWTVITLIVLGYE